LASTRSGGWKRLEAKPLHLGDPGNGAGREGIALIIVLGFLAILVILGVSFSILSRTERLAAGVYSDGVRAKHLAQVGVSRAIEQINNDLTVNQLIAPDWYVLSSQEPGGELATNVIQGETIRYVPYPLLSAVTNLAVVPQWIPITDPDQPTNLYGRVAFVAIDCSGFLDVNEVSGNPPARSNGMNAAEMDVRQMMEFNSYPLQSFSSFIDNRNAHGRYETYHELNERFGEPDSPPPLYPLTNFFVYSRARPVAFFQNNTVRPRDEFISVSPAQVETIFGLCNVPNVSRVRQNYEDFVDPGYDPQNVDDFMTEPVPMINEIVVSNRVVTSPDGLGGTLYDHRAYIVVETWFPFPIPPAPPSEPLPDFVLEFIASPVIQSTWAPPNNLLSSQPLIIQNVLNYSFQRTEFEFGSGPQTIPPPGTFILRCDLNGLEVRTAGGLVVDRVPDLPNNYFQFSGFNKTGRSCVDPRYNWRASDWASSPGMTMTTGPNHGTNANATGVGEGVSMMFVRNGPPEHVWELGFLTVGDPWQTVGLYDNPNRTLSPGLNPVVDYLWSGPSQTNAFKGLVNLNSPWRQVIAAAFDNAAIQNSPIDSINQSDPTQFFGWQTSLGVAGDITNRYWQNRNIFNISEVGHSRTHWQNPYGVQLTDSQIESVIGNTINLLTVRQNIFTVVIHAQALNNSALDLASPKNLSTGGEIADEEILSEQRAVAVVWRDPYPQTDPYYEYPFVRFFKYLTQ